MKKFHLFLSFIALILCSCSETDEQWDPYYNWEARNVEWFEQVADTARTSISEAKALFGEQWEEHCDWRMFKTYMKAADVQGPLTDSICVRILSRGQGAMSPCYNDSVRINFRGWIMPTEYMDDAGKLSTSQSVFSQTYYGTYNPLTAAPQVLCVNGTVEGFCTALQYMVEGDDWLVYIPQQMAYGSAASSTIPAYSTLLFRISLIGVYENGSGVPDWK